jgi:hypothetical protein
MSEHRRATAHVEGRLGAARRLNERPSMSKHVELTNVLGFAMYRYSIEYTAIAQLNCLRIGR